MGWSLYENLGCVGYHCNGNYAGGETCKVFQANYTSFGISSSGLSNSNIRCVDIYWRLNNITATSSQYLAIPSLAVSLYDQAASTWGLNNDQINAMLPMQQTLFKTTFLEPYKSMTMQNHSSAIYYSPRIYKVIDPNSSSSLIGLDNNYVELHTLETVQHDWPLHPNINLTRGVARLSWIFSVQPAVTTIKILTAKRQYTILSTLALLRGAWGGMSTLYVVIFGTPQLTPFGLVHQIPLLLYKKEPDYDQLQKPTGTSTLSKKFSLFKRFNKLSSSTVALNNDYNNSSSSDDAYDDEENRAIKNMTSEQLEYNNHQSLNLSIKFKKIDHRFNDVELILKNFVLNMDYYDNAKIKHLRNKLLQNDTILSSQNDDILEQQSKKKK